ncbi:hypothetical protein NPIL_121951, partial [Nephila pilipes]
MRLAFASMRALEVVRYGYGGVCAKARSAAAFVQSGCKVRKQYQVQ